MAEDSTEKQKSDRRLISFAKSKMFLAVGAAIILLVAILVVAIPNQKSYRTESYKDVQGSAGLDATITYDCKSSCDQKYNFNVYIFGENGLQVGVVRPDQEGRVRLALPEGNYVMLVGKQFGKDKLFPQEHLELKNGKQLELKLQYKEGVL